LILEYLVGISLHPAEVRSGPNTIHMKRVYLSLSAALELLVRVVRGVACAVGRPPLLVEGYSVMGHGWPALTMTINWRFQVFYSRYKTFESSCDTCAPLSEKKEEMLKSDEEMQKLDGINHEMAYIYSERKKVVKLVLSD